MARKSKNPPSPPQEAGGAEQQGDALVWTPMTELTRKKLVWSWPGRIISGTITVLEGRKGSGKSTLLATLAAATTSGKPLPGVKGKRKARSVLWLSAEEEPSLMVLPRLRNAGADLKKCFIAGAYLGGAVQRRILLPADLEQLTHAVKHLDLGMIVADPWVSFIHPAIDTNQEAPVRSVLEPLGEWCAKHDVVAMLARHLRKGNAGSAVEQGLGSTAVANVARSVLRCDKHPLRHDLKTLCVVAGNLQGNTPTLTYKIVGKDDSTLLEWEGTSNLDAESISEGSGSTGERDAMMDALKLLIEVINKRWIPANDVLAEAKTFGIGERTLRDAKAELKVRSRVSTANGSRCWEWGPPEGGWPKA